MRIRGFLSVGVYSLGLALGTLGFAGGCGGSKPETGSMVQDPPPIVGDQGSGRVEKESEPASK